MFPLPGGNREVTWYRAASPQPSLSPNRASFTRPVFVQEDGRAHATDLSRRRDQHEISYLVVLRMYLKDF